MRDTQPNKTVAWRMPEPTRSAVVELAKYESRSLGNMLRVLITEALAARNSKQSPTRASQEES